MHPYNQPTTQTLKDGTLIKEALMVAR